MQKNIEIIVGPTHKGGVGKSLILRLMYQALARVLKQNGEDRKILVVDMDGQANTTERWINVELESNEKILGKMPIPHPELDGERSDITDIWLKGVAPLPYPTLNPRIDIVPAREILMGEVIRTNLDADAILLMREWLQGPEIAEEYCAVFIDTPPSKEFMTQAALAAATQCFVPMKYEAHPIGGIASMMHLIDNEGVTRGADYPDLNFLGIVANDIGATNSTLYREYKEAVKNNPLFGPYLLPYEIKRLTAFAETDAKSNLPGDIFDYPSKNYSHAIRMTEQFCENMFRRIDSFADWDLNFRKGESFFMGEDEINGTEGQ